MSDHGPAPGRRSGPLGGTDRFEIESPGSETVLTVAHRADDGRHRRLTGHQYGGA